jgi:MerR family transcriptional regulator, light-induced transcriptional regulator
VTTRPGSLTLQAAADELGVHYMTVYRYVRQGRLPAVRQGSQWRVRPTDLEVLRHGGSVPRRRVQRREADLEGLERRMLAGDSAGVWWLIESHLGAGLDPSGALTELVAPALHSIGARWAAGEVSIAEEHQATAVAFRVIGRLGLQFGRPGRSRGAVALGAPAGDLHTLPVAIAADLLRWRGFDVVELGGNTPAQAMAEATKGAQRLVGVGIVSTTAGLEAEVAATVAAVRLAVPEAVIFLGGAAIGGAAEASELGADVWTGAGARAAVDTVERLAAAGSAE